VVFEKLDHNKFRELLENPEEGNQQPSFLEID
jgi:hypothetical protein